MYDEVCRPVVSVFLTDWRTAWQTWNLLEHGSRLGVISGFKSVARPAAVTATQQQ